MSMVGSSAAGVRILTAESVHTVLLPAAQPAGGSVDCLRIEVPGGLGMDREASGYAVEISGNNVVLQKRR